MDNNIENNKDRSILPLVIIFLVILALVGGAYWFGKNSMTKEEPQEQEAMTDERDLTSSEFEALDVSEEESVVDDERSDEKSVETGLEDTDEEVIEILKLAFAQKYEKKVDDVRFTISKREGNYLTGGVKFSDEGAGGYVLAAKVNGAWKIVFDGNGIFTCNAVDDVNFPSSLAPECWDEATMSTVYRTEDR